MPTTILRAGLMFLLACGAAAAAAAPAAAWCVKNVCRGQACGQVRVVALTPERGALDQTLAAGQEACCPSTEARCNPKSKTVLRVTLLDTGEPERHTQEVETFPCGVVRVSPKSVGGFHELGVMVLEGDDPWCRGR